MIIDEEEYLAHYGIPGMKWGVRRERRIQSLDRAIRGEGGVATKARALSKLTPVDLVKGRGIRGGSQRKAARNRARNARVQAGQGRLRDNAVYYGSTRVSDLIPVRSKNVNKKTTVSGDKVAVAAVGAFFIASLLAGK